jgi:hypothetical protein
VRLWDSKKGVIEAVDSLTKVYSKTQTIPAELIRAYKVTLGRVAERRPGLVQEFYDRMADRCPDALPLFGDGKEGAPDGASPG